MNWTERRERFRAILSGNRCVHPGSVYDAISARIAEDLGFEVGMFAGSIGSMSVLGAPDLIVLTLTEFAAQAYRICRAGNLALLVDSDHGYGNALNVKRTVEELETAGVAALTIEDTLLPRPFGSSGKPALIPLEEGIGKMRAALAGRQDPNLVVAGRTSALAIAGVDETIKRTNAYAAAGVDAVFLSGAKTRAEIEAVSSAVRIPLFLGGTTGELADLDFLSAHNVKVCLQGHAPFSAAVHAVYETLKALRAGVPPHQLKNIATSELMRPLVLDPPIGDHVAQRFVSRDGGATWQLRTFAGRPRVSEIATWGGVTFGMAGELRDPNGGAATDDNIPFVRSDDGMRTWRAIDQQIVATGQWVTKFWVNGRTGAILAQTNKAWLWETGDLGVHWTRLPEASSPYVHYMVQDVVASDLWRICAFVSDGSSAPPILTCSEDSGKTWIDSADISISIPCPVCAKGKPGNVVGIPAPVGIASDGAVIVADLGGLTSDYQWISALYRLEPGATKWQSLGVIPYGAPDTHPQFSEGRAIWTVSGGPPGVYATTYP